MSGEVNGRLVGAEGWRRALRKDLAWLRKATRFRRWSEKRVAAWERRLVVAAAQVMVVADHAGVPPSLASQPFGCVTYPRRPGATPPPAVGPAEVPALYDLDAPEATALLVGSLCRLVLDHAFMGVMSRSPRRFTHVWVAGRDEPVLYELETGVLVDFLARFAAREGPSPAPEDGEGKAVRRRRRERGEGAGA